MGCLVTFLVVAVLLGIIGIIYNTRKDTKLAENHNIKAAWLSSWLLSVEHCNYKYTNDGYGIAIDIPNKKIYLASMIDSASVVKEYNTSDIREWEYVMPGADLLYTIGHEGFKSAPGRRNATDAQAKDAISNTGLWLTVKDIDYPKWFIQFRCEEVQDPKTKMELSRWMEILQQNINEA